MKVHLLFLLSMVTFCSLVCSSCQVEKRIHRPGYHVQWFKSINRSRTKESNIVQVKDEPKQYSSSNAKIELEELTAGVQNELLVVPNNLKPIDNHKEIVSDCDTIILVTGERILARIAEITPSYLLYEDCLQPSESFLKIERSRLSAIIYRNGIIEQYEPPQEQVPAITKQKRQMEPLGFISVIFGIASFFWIPWILAPLAVIAAGNSIARIARNPHHYSGLVLSILGLVLGIFMLIIVLIVIF